MKKLGYWILISVLLTSFLAGCAATSEPAAAPEPTEAPAAAPEPTEAPAAEPMGEEVTMVIGFTTSQTGSYNVSSLRQVNGLLQWMNEVFGPFINKILDSGAEAILGGGHFQDGSTFARQIHEKDANVKFFALLVAPPEPDFADLGDAAVGVIGPSQWEPLAEFTPDSAEEAGLEWFGALGSDFVAGYEAAYNEEPSYHSMGGYAAGQILQKAIMDADSTDPEAVKAAMDAMDILTTCGHIKFGTSEETHGLQIGHSMVYIQWQKDDAGNLVKQVVWPLEGKTADPLYPKP